MPGMRNISPGGRSNHSDPEPTRPKPKPWKQRAIQLESTSYYLNKVKQARGLESSPQKAKGYPRPLVDGGACGYAEQVRQRAGAIEATQAREEGERLDRGYAMIHRLQERAQNLPSSRSTSTDSMKRQVCNL